MHNKEMGLCDTIFDAGWKIVKEHKIDMSEANHVASLIKEAQGTQTNEAFLDKLNELMKTFKNGKLLQVEGRFQFADRQNENGRVYPFAILKRETDKLHKVAVARRLLGELDHPEIINTSLKNASHLITKLEMKNKEVIGRMEVLPTSAGNDLRALFESYVDVGVSSRGAGRVIEQDDYYEVAEDYIMKTYDAVTDPSTQEAYPKMLSEAQIIRLPKKQIVVEKSMDNIKHYGRRLSGII